MTFEVHINKRRKRKILFGQILCILMIAAMGWSLAFCFGEGSGAYWLLAGLTEVFVCFLLLSFYFQRRPRILVEGSIITVYPVFGRAIRMTKYDITSRKVKAGYTDQQIISSAVSTWGGIPGYIFYDQLSKRKMTGLPKSCAWEYTYYKGKKKLIRIVSGEMENAERFDQMVCEYLKGKAAESDWNSISGNPENQTGKKPTALFWLGYIVFLVAFIILTEYVRTR